MKKNFRLFVSLFLVIASCLTLIAQSDHFDIEIKRNFVKNNLVYCDIYLNDQKIGKAYENDNLKIKAGTYKGLMRYNSGKNFVQSNLGRMSRKGDFLLEVAGVEGRTNILLHPGNKPKDSKGCILLGPAYKGIDGAGYINDDHPLRILRLKFYGTEFPTYCPNKNITITIVDEEINLSGTYSGNCKWSIIKKEPVELVIKKSGSNYTGKHTSNLNRTTSDLKNFKVNHSNKNISFEMFGYEYKGYYKKKGDILLIEVDGAAVCKYTRK